MDTRAVTDISSIEDSLRNAKNKLKHIASSDSLIVTKDVFKEIKDTMNEVLSGFGISVGRMTDALVMGSGESRGVCYRQESGERLLSKDQLPPLSYFVQNVSRMIALEKKCPGAVRFLHTERGIKNFVRYSVAFWERQFLERHAPDPYMVVINPTNLEKEGLVATKVYTDLQNNLAQLSVPHKVRFIEVEDIQSLLRQFVRLQQTYNKDESNPIPVVLFDGHGVAERVLLSGAERKDSFGWYHLIDWRFERIFKKHLSNTFSRNVQFILGSCEAAVQKNGENTLGPALKQAMRRIFSSLARVTASPYSLYPFSSIESEFKNGVLTVQPKGWGYNEGTKRTVSRGVMRNL